MDEIASSEAPPDWLAAVSRGRADAAAGHVVPIDTVLAKLRHARDRLQRLEPGTSGTPPGP